MPKAKKALMFAGAVMVVLAFAPIAMAFADKLTGGAIGNVLTQVQTGTAGALGVSQQTEIGGQVLPAD